jgi:hypothetical protein
MLVNPGKRDHEIGWHRDLVSTELPPDKEQTALMQVVRSVQWNTALYDEACLYIVPGSHTRVSTDEARDIVKNRSFDAMPGQIAVELKAGHTTPTCCIEANIPKMFAEKPSMPAWAPFRGPRCVKTCTAGLPG